MTTLLTPSIQMALILQADGQRQARIKSKRALRLVELGASLNVRQSNFANVIWC